MFKEVKFIRILGYKSAKVIIILRKVNKRGVFV